jgi:hypothetical protein
VTGTSVAVPCDGDHRSDGASIIASADLVRSAPVRTAPDSSFAARFGARPRCCTARVHPKKKERRSALTKVIRSTQLPTATEKRHGSVGGQRFTGDL